MNERNPRTKYDTTRYANFEPTTVANMSGDDLRDEGRITGEERNRLAMHYEGSDARSVAEMVEQAPYWMDESEKEHLAACGDMHAEPLEVELPPLSDPKITWDERGVLHDARDDGDGDESDGESEVDLQEIVRGVLAEYGHDDADTREQASGAVSVQLHGAESLRDVVGDLLDRYLSVDVDQIYECPPSLLVSMNQSVESAVESGDWNVKEGWDAYDHGPNRDADADDETEEGMVIALTYGGGSGIDERVRTYDQSDGDLIVTYTDGSTAVYENGMVQKAWASREAAEQSE